jgi:hypothetical protein
MRRPRWRVCGVSLRSVKRIAEESAVVHVDDAAERAQRQIGRPSTVANFRKPVLEMHLNDVVGVGHPSAIASGTGLGQCGRSHVLDDEFAQRMRNSSHIHRRQVHHSHFVPSVQARKRTCWCDEKEPIDYTQASEEDATAEKRETRSRRTQNRAQSVLRFQPQRQHGCRPRFVVLLAGLKRTRTQKPESSSN